MCFVAWRNACADLKSTLYYCMHIMNHWVYLKTLFKGLIRIRQQTKQFNWWPSSLRYTYSLFSTFPVEQSFVWHVITFRIPKIQYIAGWTILLWCIGNQIARKVCTNQEFLFSWFVFICKSQILSRQSRLL